MKSYRNPFRSRTSEQQQQQGLQRFLKTYGADVLDLLPEEPWDRPVVIRSAPGGGKTSLLRAFTVEAVSAVAERPDDFEDLHRRLVDLGAIDSGRPSVLGVHISLAQGFKDLMDLGVESDASRKLFFRLLDSQIIRAVCEAALRLGGMRYPQDLSRLNFSPSVEGQERFDVLGGTSAEALWSWSRTAQRQIRELLDSVLPVSWEGVQGHATLYSLEALSGAELVLNGATQKVRPLIMFDDGQELTATQRSVLLECLTARGLEVGRWYTERYSALQPDEVIGDGEPGRGHTVVPLEARARAMRNETRNGRRLRPYESMLLDVADRRARKALADYGDETDVSFRDFLETDDQSALDDRSEEAVGVISQRVLALTSGRTRYDEWLSTTQGLRGYESALRWRELEIVITRDQGRTQLELIDFPLTEEELKAQSASNIREAAALFLRQEFRVPYYFGSRRAAALASQNIEQFLVLSGNFFEEMLALVTLQKRPWLDPISQDRIVRSTSEMFWKAIPQRRSYGRDMQHLLLRVGNLSQRDTYRPTAPYAPGVTGTALSMRDRSRLLNPEVRARIPGAESLYRALGAAIGHNLLSAETDRRVKNNTWMVLYLNRMLCARFNLPLGYGGFRERSLEEMSSWMSEAPSGDLSGIEVPAMFNA